MIYRLIGMNVTDPALVEPRPSQRDHRRHRRAVDHRWRRRRARMCARRRSSHPAHRSATGPTHRSTSRTSTRRAGWSSWCRRPTAHLQFTIADDEMSRTVAQIAQAEPRGRRAERRDRGARRGQLLRHRTRPTANASSSTPSSGSTTASRPRSWCGSPATRSTSGTTCTGATRSTARCSRKLSVELDRDARNEIYIEMQRDLGGGGEHGVGLAPDDTSSLPERHRVEVVCRRRGHGLLPDARSRSDRPVADDA